MRLDRIIAAVAGVLGLGGLALLVRARRSELEGSATVTPLEESVKAATGLRVLNIELAQQDGVRPQLVWLLEQWEAHGSHVVEIRSRAKFPYFPSGSVRWTADEQADAAKKGLSGAVKPNDSAHGPRRRAGLDVQPVGFNPHRSFAEQPGMFDLCRTFALWAEQQVHPDGTRFKSGRHFTSIVAPDGVVGDWVHVEIQGWASLPLLAEERR